MSALLHRPSPIHPANGHYKGVPVHINDQLVSPQDLANGVVSLRWDCEEDGHLWSDRPLGASYCVECSVQADPITNLDIMSGIIQRSRKTEPDRMERWEDLTFANFTRALETTSLSAEDATAAIHNLRQAMGMSAANAAAALGMTDDQMTFDDTTTLLLKYAARRLPDEEFCGWAEAEAEKLGMKLSWHVKVDGDRPKDAWCEVDTGRGKMVVRASGTRSWQMAFADDLGIGTGL